MRTRFHISSSSSSSFSSFISLVNSTTATSTAAAAVTVVDFSQQQFFGEYNPSNRFNRQQPRQRKPSEFKSKNFTTSNLPYSVAKLNAVADNERFARHQQEIEQKKTSSEQQQQQQQQKKMQEEQEQKPTTTKSMFTPSRKHPQHHQQQQNQSQQHITGSQIPYRPKSDLANAVDCLLFRISRDPNPRKNLGFAVEYDNNNTMNNNSSSSSSSNNNNDNISKILENQSPIARNAFARNVLDPELLLVMNSDIQLQSQKFRPELEQGIAMDATPWVPVNQLVRNLPEERLEELENYKGGLREVIETELVKICDVRWNERSKQWQARKRPVHPLLLEVAERVTAAFIYRGIPRVDQTNLAQTWPIAFRQTVASKFGGLGKAMMQAAVYCPNQIWRVDRSRDYGEVLVVVARGKEKEFRELANAAEEKYQQEKQQKQKQQDFYSSFSGTENNSNSSSNSTVEGFSKNFNAQQKTTNSSSQNLASSGDRANDADDVLEDKEFLEAMRILSKSQNVENTIQQQQKPSSSPSQFITGGLNERMNMIAATNAQNKTLNTLVSPAPDKLRYIVGAARHVESSTMNAELLLQYVPSFFIPLDIALQHLAPQGYTEQHLQQYFSRSKSLQVVSLPDYSNSENNNNNSENNNEMKTFIRVFGLRGEFDMKMSIDTNYKPQHHCYFPDPKFARYFIDILKQHRSGYGQWMSLRELLEIANNKCLSGEIDLVKDGMLLNNTNATENEKDENENQKKILLETLLPYQGPQALLYFAQLQHIFMFTPQHGGMIALANPENVDLNFDTTPCPIFCNEIFGYMFETKHRIRTFEDQLEPDVLKDMKVFFPDSSPALLENENENENENNKNNSNDNDNEPSSSSSNSSENETNKIKISHSVSNSVLASWRNFVNCHPSLFFIDENNYEIHLVRNYQRDFLKLSNSPDSFDAQIDLARRNGKSMKAIRRIMRNAHLEQHKDHPYLDCNTLAKAIHDLLPPDTHISVRVFTKKVPQEVKLFIPVRHSLYKFMLRFPQQFTVFDYYNPTFDTFEFHVIRAELPLPKDVAYQSEWTPKEVVGFVTNLLLKLKENPPSQNSQNSRSDGSVEIFYLMWKLPTKAREYTIRRADQLVELLKMLPNSFVIVGLSADNVAVTLLRPPTEEELDEIEW